MDIRLEPNDLEKILEEYFEKLEINFSFEGWNFRDSKEYTNITKDSICISITYR